MTAISQNELKKDIELQVEEIIKHKWCLSEKTGYDVGIEFASLDWAKKYAALWREWREKTHYTSG